MSFFRIQFKVDVYVVVISVCESGWKRINPCHALSHGFDRFIDDHIAGGSHDLEIGDPPILFDPDLHQRGEPRAGCNYRGWLRPFFVKTVVQHVAVPCEV